MNVLLTGASGFIGTNLLKELSSKEFNIFCLKRSNSKIDHLGNYDINWIEKDLRENISFNVEFDLVIHVAGIVSSSNPEAFNLVNVKASVNLANAVLKSSPNLKRFLYVSSQTAAGPSPDLNNPKKETDIDEPITHYGKSKKLAESELSKIDKLPLTIIRPSAVYGEFDKAILTIFQSMKFFISTQIGFNTKYVSLVNVKDLCKAIVDSSLSENTLGKSYFIASKQAYDWPLLLNKIQKYMGKSRVLKLRIPHFIVFTLGYLSGLIGKFSNSNPVFDKDKAIDLTQDYWICDISEAEKDFNFKEEISIDEGIKSTIKWYKDNNWL